MSTSHDYGFSTAEWFSSQNGQPVYPTTRSLVCVEGVRDKRLKGGKVVVPPKELLDEFVAKFGKTPEAWCLLCDGRVVAIDAERDDIAAWLMARFPNARVEKGSKGAHLFFTLTDEPVKKRGQAKAKDGTLACEILVNWACALSGSKHREKDLFYSTLREGEIVKITHTDLSKTLDDMANEFSLTWDSASETIKPPEQENVLGRLPASLKDDVERGAQEGNRNAARFSLAMRLIAAGLNEKELQQALLVFNKKCNPPEAVGVVTQHARQIYRNAEKGKLQVPEPHLPTTETFDPFALADARKDELQGITGYRVTDFTWFGDDVPECLVAKCPECGAIEKVSRENLVRTGAYPKECNTKSCRIMHMKMQIYDEMFWTNYAAMSLWEYEFFADQFDEFFAAHTDAHGVRRIFPIRSEQMRGRLALTLKSRAKIDQAVLFLEGLARRAGKVRRLELRVASHEGANWLDLCNDKGEAIRLDADGWQVVPKPPIIFKRYKHMLPLQADPTGTKADLDAFLDLFNFQSPEDRMLYTGFMVQLSIPDIDRPIAVIVGAQGAAKTTAATGTRLLFDPSALPTLNMSKDPDELPQKILHHYLPTFDNCNYLTQEVSDLLCQASSGMGFSKRKLFTDGEDVSYIVRRPLILDGVGTPSMAPDFLDRATIIHLERITPEMRRERSEIEAVRDALLPKVRGYILNIISEGLREAKTAPKEKVALPRLADYARAADACLTQIGYAKGEFLKAYIAANFDVAQQAVQADPVAAVLLEFLEGTTEWEGTASELYRQLEARAGSATKSPGWVKSHNWLSEALLGRLKPGLRSLGWQVTKGRTGQRRTLKISKVTGLEVYC